MQLTSFFNLSKWLQKGGKFGLIGILLASVLAFAVLPAAADADIPTFTIVDVVKDKTVTIQTSNFPADETFKVLMGPIGTKGINGLEVATTETGKGGTIEATYDIPETLKGMELISIRLESESGYYAYNWFYNADPEPAAKETNTNADTEVKYTGIPTFSITKVTSGKSVTILTENFPSDQEFTVRMGEYGTKAVDGIEVAKTSSQKGGTLEETYKIPKELAKKDRIAIRMDSADGAYYSYNWFYNADWPLEEVQAEEASTEAGTEETAVYNSTPTLSIVKVAAGSSVTISATNLPPDDTFTVLMGTYGTKGVDGIEVGKLKSEAEEPLEKTYDIPKDLAEEDAIAIRLESESGYYAYNWFYNAQYPAPESEYAGIPTFTISKVEKGKTVSILTKNFPPDLEFAVRMGAYGSRAMDGVEVDTFKTGDGGELELTFDIPTDFVDSDAIAIRLDSADGVYSAYNWFYNK